MAKSIIILGTSELNAIFKELPAQMNRQILNSALTMAASVVKKAVREEVPVKQGTLKKGIVTKRGGDKQNPSALVGPLKSKSGPWYAHFVNFGTKGFGKRTRKYAGKVEGVRKFKTLKYSRVGGGLKANPFMERGFDKSKDKAIDNFHAILSKATTNFLRRKAPKYFT